MIKIFSVGAVIAIATYLYSSHQSELVVAELPLPEQVFIPVDRNAIKQKVRVYHEVMDREVNMESEIGCMSANIFFESGNQPDLGKVAVAHVTKRRSNMFGNKTVCDAVKKTKYDEYGMIKVNLCNFSWHCDGNAVKWIKNNPSDNVEFQFSYMIGKGVMDGKLKDPTNGADHYCTLAVEKLWLTQRKGGAWWIDYMIPSSRIVIGDHVFYKHDPKKFNEAWQKKKYQKIT